LCFGRCPAASLQTLSRGECAGHLPQRNSGSSDTLHHMLKQQQQQHRPAHQSQHFSPGQIGGKLQGICHSGSSSICPGASNTAQPHFTPPPHPPPPTTTPYTVTSRVLRDCWLHCNRRPAVPHPLTTCPLPPAVSTHTFMLHAFLFPACVSSGNSKRHSLSHGFVVILCFAESSMQSLCQHIPHHLSARLLV
jgi:hypothetical protein